MPRTAGAVFRLGDDVVHAAFGDGVVIATEPGGIVVVRFAGDGSRRDRRTSTLVLSGGS